MNSNFREYSPDQTWLFPPALRDLIAADDPLHVFSEVIDRLDLSAFYSRYSQEGNPAYHPRMMVKVLAYAYSLGLRSSRRIASLLRYDVRFMYLAGRQQPDFRTLSDFRLRHLPEFSRLFEQIVRLCQELGLVTLEHVAIDGTKIEAQAAWRNSRTRLQLEAESQALQDQIRQILAEAEAIDRQEDAQFGSDRTGAELPPELASLQSRQQKLDAALQKLQERSERRINLGDPDARVMRHYGGKKDWSYNAQIAVDHHQQVIVAAQVTTETTDLHQLVPMYQQTLANTGQKPAEISADSGYASNANLLFLQENEVNAYMPAPFFESTPAPTLYSREQFRYDASQDVFLCPRGQILKLLRVYRKQGVAIRVYRCPVCPVCPQQQLCLRRGRYRTLKVSATENYRDTMRAKLKSPAGWQTYLKRLATVEPVIGHLKCLLRFRDFLLQGLDKVQGEFQLIASVHNLRKICLKLRQQAPPGWCGAGNPN